jgi:hypothetical protein
MATRLGTRSNQVTFDPTPITVDKTWGLRLTLPNGDADIVSGFASEAEARAWLAGRLCDQWLKARNYARDESQAP